MAARSVVVRRTGVQAAWRAMGRSSRLRLLGLASSVVVLSLLFVRPLAQLLDLALQNDLHSYVPLVPVISAYLLYSQANYVGSYRTSIGAAAILAAAGVAALVASFQFDDRLSVDDALPLRMLAYVSVLGASGFLFVGSDRMRAAAFPVAFLVFMVPLPGVAVNWLELKLVEASADAAALLFTWTGTPLFRQGTVFTLPNIVLEVAQECSGIRSTVVLFITSVLASNLFLQSTWRRIAIVAFVIPLAIVRNGFRVLVIGLLCVYVGPHMSDSFIHHSGGPIFFVLSLAPLSLFLVWLRRHDRVGARS
ncbi:MAG TPA: exosortase/archaeosortase family protein [Vicinamibacterales bacterium]|nr:exosortase/archaeosortase family protein [Vicinamibacterales bacterium]